MTSWNYFFIDREEIEYIMMCVDANQDGKVDFHEFTDRFHNPAKDIGFNVAVLLTNLSEHMPGDSRLTFTLPKTFIDLHRCIPPYCVLSDWSASWRRRGACWTTSSRT